MAESKVKWTVSTGFKGSKIQVRHYATKGEAVRAAKKIQDQGAGRVFRIGMFVNGQLKELIVGKDLIDTLCAAGDEETPHFDLDGDQIMHDPPNIERETYAVTCENLDGAVDTLYETSLEALEEQVLDLLELGVWQPKLVKWISHGNSTTIADKNGIGPWVNNARAKQAARAEKVRVHEAEQEEFENNEAFGMF